MTIALFDPSVGSMNLGDEIIREAVVRELSSLMPSQQIIGLPTQDIIGRRSIRISRNADWRIVGGTNLLSSHMLKYRQWRINLADALRMGTVILCGVGWWQYQERPDRYTSAVLRRVLDRDAIHSVRDEYTRSKLIEIGVPNVVNTGCPTMWDVDFNALSLKSGKSEGVVFTVTDYHKNVERDRLLLKTLRDFYPTIYFWPQGSGDLEYLTNIDDIADIVVIDPNVPSFDAVLSKNVDFIGTRLHAGIRALQKGVRAIIIETDNRAKEIANTTGLTVIKVEDRSELVNAIGADLKPITMNNANIALWRSQFVSKCRQQTA